MDEGETNRTPAGPVSAPQRKPLRFIHQKDGQFRSYHADGAWAIIAASGNLHLHFFTEYPKMADQLFCPVKPDGTYEQVQIGSGELDEKEYVVMRDVQCDIILSMQAVKALLDQLNYFVQSRQQNQTEQNIKRDDA